jgi:hypothetical protein
MAEEAYGPEKQGGRFGVTDLAYATDHADKPTSSGKKGRLDAILAPCGGGGMLSGVALSCEGTGCVVPICFPA